MRKEKFFVGVEKKVTPAEAGYLLVIFYDTV